MEQPKNDSLIAYNVLEKKIIKGGFCTLCGACEAACPVGAIQVEGEKVKRLHDCSKDLDLCPICYGICPHSEALLLRSLSCVSDAPIKNEALGYYRKILLAQSTDPKLRDKSHGGAVVTTLLTYGIEKKAFDSAIVSQAEQENPALPKPAIATVPDDIFSAIGSKFFPSSVAKAYGSAVYGYGKTKIAFVGVPCHLLALRKMEAWQHKISDSLKITIGLFCFGTFSLTPLLNFIEKKYKIQPSQIKRMRLSNSFVVETEEETVRIPISEMKENIMPSCRTCTDFSAELADISIGGAYPFTDWSVVIIRTKAGEDFFYDAVENGLISTWVIEQEPKVFERIMVAAMQKRTNALKEAKALEQEYGYLPSLMLRESEVLAKSKVKDIMTKTVRTVPEDLTINQFLELVAKRHHIAYPVINKAGEPFAVATLEEAAKVDTEARNDTLITKINLLELVAVHPEETALDAFKKMEKHGVGRVIVIEPERPSCILGIVTKTDLMHILTNSVDNNQTP